MWIFTKYGFFSVTQHAQRRDLIQIRARTDRDIAELVKAYPMLDRCPMHETPDADYRFRLVIARWKWDLLGAKLTADIDYHNFKGKVATIPTQAHKGDMLHRIWDIHHRYQEDRHRPDPLAGHPELFRKAGDPLFEDDPNDGVNYEDDDWMPQAPEPDPYMEQNRKAVENTLSRNAERTARKAAKENAAAAAIHRAKRAKRGNGSILTELEATYQAAKADRRKKRR